MNFGQSKPLDDGKITKKKDSKKQEFKDIVSHIELLEDKVDQLLSALDGGNDFQNENTMLYNKPTSGTEFGQIPFTPATFSPIPIRANNGRSSLGDSKMAAESPFSKYSPTHPSYKGMTSNKDTPLNFLAEVITNEHEHRLITEQIECAEQVHLKSNIPSPTALHSSDSLTDTQPITTHQGLNSALQNDWFCQDSWSVIRKYIPQEQISLYDSVSVEDMFINTAKEEKIYQLLENTETKTVPDISIMAKAIDLFLNLCSAHVLIPLESYDLLGILNKWRFDGLKSLNHSHLLILNVVGSFMCKDIRSSVFLKNDPNGLKMRELLKGFESSLLNHDWLAEWEDFFLANSLLHYQHITMFPDGLASVQGILLLLMYVPLTGLNLSESLMQTTAVRICQDLGLHSERFLNVINKKKKMLRDKKKKIWWFCCFSDEMLSMMLAKPRMIIHYTSSIQFTNDDKTKVLELLEQELDKVLILQRVNEKDVKFYDEDNSEAIENLNTQIQETIIRIYKEEGIFIIMKYYFFKIINIIQKNVSKIEKKCDSAITEQILDDLINVSSNLPLVIKDPTLFKDVWGDDSFFLYFIHLALYFIQDHSYCLLYSTNDSREYIDFIKQHLTVLLKIKSCEKSYNAMFGLLDKAIFTKITKIVQYHIIKPKYEFRNCLQDYQFIKNFLTDYLSPVGSAGEPKNHNDSDEPGIKKDPFIKDTIQELDPWLNLKKDGFFKLLELLKQIGIHRRAQNFEDLNL